MSKEIVSELEYPILKLSYAIIDKMNLDRIREIYNTLCTDSQNKQLLGEMSDLARIMFNKSSDSNRDAQEALQQIFELTKKYAIYDEESFIKDPTSLEVQELKESIPNMPKELPKNNDIINQINNILDLLRHDTYIEQLIYIIDRNKTHDDIKQLKNTLCLVADYVSFFRDAIKEIDEYTADQYNALARIVRKLYPDKDDAWHILDSTFYQRNKVFSPPKLVELIPKNINGLINPDIDKMLKDN